MTRCAKDPTCIIALLLCSAGVLYGADAAALVSETIPDNTPQIAGATYKQTWTIKNTGTTNWDTTYSLQYVSGNAGCNHAASVLSVTVAPNTTVDWWLNCTAPAAPGTYREDWKLLGPSGAIAMGASGTVWVQIVVAGASGGADAATFGSETIPDNTTEPAGAAYTQTWTIKNTGTTDWGGGYSLLYASENAGCNHPTSALTVPIAANTGVNWGLSCIAPSAPGTYREDWKLVGPSGAISVGGYATVWVQIVVAASGGSDVATLGSETIADNTPEAPGASYSQVWTIRNTGTTTWGSNYSLQYVSGDAGCNHTTSVLSVTIAPNASVNWTVNCTAPASPGTFREDWKLVGPSGAIAVGASSTVWLQVVVKAGQ